MAEETKYSHRDQQRKRDRQVDIKIYCLKYGHRERQEKTKTGIETGKKWRTITVFLYTVQQFRRG